MSLFLSKLKEITASIIQGSGLGPASYSVNASDLHPVNILNSMGKFADDTYLIVAGKNAATRIAEIENVQNWATANNLLLNHSKSAEIIFTRPRLNQIVKNSLPHPVLGIPRVSSIKLLGVTISENLSVSDHVRATIGSCAQSLYALRMLRAHGLDSHSVQTVYNAIVMSKLLYASPAWYGFTSKEDRDRIDSFMKKSSKFAFAPPDQTSFASLCEKLDDKMFEKVSLDEHHVLHCLLPPVNVTGHNLRRRTHSFVLPAKCKTVLQDKNFFKRVLYKDSY